MFNTHNIHDAPDMLYARYIKEREDKEIVYHIEAGKVVGFATYKDMSVGDRRMFYIVDIYVDDKFRKQALASRMADDIAAKAKKSGVEWLLGSVDINTAGTEASVMTLIHYGFKITKTHGPMIYFEKYLGVS